MNTSISRPYQHIVDPKTAKVITDNIKLFYLALTIGLIWFLSMFAIELFLNLSNFPYLLGIAIVSATLFIIIVIDWMIKFAKAGRYLALLPGLFLILFSLGSIQANIKIVNSGIESYTGTCEVYVGRSNEASRKGLKYYIMESHVSLGESSSDNVTAKTSESQFSLLTGIKSYPQFAPGESDTIACDGLYEIHYRKNINGENTVINIERIAEVRLN